MRNESQWTGLDALNGRDGFHDIENRQRAWCLTELIATAGPWTRVNEVRRYQVLQDAMQVAAEVPWSFQS